MRFAYLTFVAAAAASAVINQAKPMYKVAQANNHVYARQLRPPRVVDQALPTDVIPLEPVQTPTTTLNDPTITPPPESESDDSSTCTPLTICVDKITCGVRYGGCYDRNFCTGTTSFPVPAVTCSAGSGFRRPPRA